MITRKKCKCSTDCDKFPTIGYGGYFATHATDELKKKVGTKRQVAVRNRNNRVALSAKLHKAQKAANSEQELWYWARRYEMVGKCSENGCNEPTNKKDDRYYRWSVCHLVPKSLCPSVATNFYNWIELCWGHHSEFDSTFDKAASMKCFVEAKRKFGLFQHLIPANELRKVNPDLLTEGQDEGVELAIIMPL